MSVFTPDELAYLRQERRLARVATVGPDGTPHVVPGGFSYNPTHDTIDLGGHDVGRTKKYRDVARTGRAAVVIDDIVSTDPRHVRGVEIRGHAEAVPEHGGLIRLYPQRIVSWGLSPAAPWDRTARSVGHEDRQVDVSDHAVG